MRHSQSLDELRLTERGQQVADASSPGQPAEKLAAVRRVVDAIETNRVVRWL